MESDETTTATTGGLEKLTFLTGTGRHRAQIVYFFRMQIGPRTPTAVALIVGKRPYRIRRHCGGLVLPESPGSETCPKDA